MFCEKCGNRIVKRGNFCEKCGTKLENARVQVNSREVKNVSPKIIGMVAIIAILVIILMVYGVNKSMTVNLNDYLEVSFEGYDTAGYASVEFDKKTFEKDFGQKIKFKNTGEMSSFVEPIDLFWFCISGNLDQTSNLINGDSVTYLWDVNETEIAKRLNLKIEYENEVFEVKGLEEIKTFDPFDGIEIIYSGIAPKGVAELVNDSISKKMDGLHYELDRGSELSNGDEITVSIKSKWEDDISEYCLNEFGMIPSVTEKVFVVDGLGEYVTNITDISEDAFSQMKAQGIDVFNAYVASDWDIEHERVNSINYIGSYFLLPKSNDVRLKNNLYLVYEINASDVYEEYGFNQNYVFYFYISFRDIVKTADGTCTVDVMRYDVPTHVFERKVQYGNESENYNYYDYVGYETLDSLKNDCIITQIDSYTYETTFENNEQ